jgi:hypothetical protein
MSKLGSGSQEREKGGDDGRGERSVGVWGRRLSPTVAVAVGVRVLELCGALFPNRCRRRLGGGAATRPDGERRGLRGGVLNMKVGGGGRCERREEVGRADARWGRRR